MSAPKKALQARTTQLDFTSTLGQHSIITSQSNLAGRGGFYCQTCDVLLKDSQSYTLHLNGRKHQSKLNVSMQARRVKPEEVITKLAVLSKKHPHPYEFQCSSIEQLNVQTQMEIDDIYGLGESDNDHGDMGETNHFIDDSHKKPKPNDYHANHDHSAMSDNDVDSTATKAALLVNQQLEKERTFEIAFDDGDWDDTVEYSDEEGVEYIKIDSNETKNAPHPQTGENDEIK